MLVTVAPTLFRLQQKNNSDSWGYLFHIRDGHEYEHCLDSTQRQQLLHHCLVLLLGRCNYYLHSNVATLPPHLQGLRFLVVFDLPLATPVLDGSPPGHRYARPLASTLLVFEDPPCPLYYAINYHDLCNSLKSPLVQYANRPRATVMRSSAGSIKRKCATTLQEPLNYPPVVRPRCRLVVDSCGPFMWSFATAWLWSCYKPCPLMQIAG